MKIRILLILALGWTLVGTAQKNELKAATKALKGGDTAAAQAALETAEPLIAGADAKYQTQYYKLKGDVYSRLAQADASQYGTAIDAYNKVLEMEAGGKGKYTTEIQQNFQQMVADLVNGAVTDQNNSNFKSAASKLYMGYQLSKQDTIYLYYAASSAVNGKEYDDAVKYYNELKALNYDGSRIKYTALNNESQQREEYPDASQRDLFVKAGTHSDPKDEKTPSKKAEIVKNLALIYQQQGKNDEALAAYEDAMAANPEDVNLVLNKANLYYTLGDKDKFKELMSQASAMDPNNPDLLYNIGVINMEQGNMEEARAAYQKALEVNPNYVNAVLNLSTTYINEGNALIDEMNELALSNKRADYEKYDQLKAKKENLFKEGASVLESALEGNPGNTSILEQLKNIYQALGDVENYRRLKGLLGEE